MPILIKSPADLEKMRAAGRVVASVHARLREVIAPGVTTGELDVITGEMIAAAGGTPSFLGYHGFPASICTSVNEQLVHGIPGPRTLNEGDIISIDIGVYLDGFHGDAAVTLPVGIVSAQAAALIEATEAAFWAGFARVREGGRWGDAAEAIQAEAEARGCAIIREYCGHGIGRRMHEDPSAPNYGTSGTGPRLRRGMTIAIEPMLSAGSPAVRELEDGWTVVTVDGSLTAHYEHTVAVDGEHALLLTGDGSRVL